MRILVTVTAFCLSLTGLATASETDASIRKPTSIAAQALEPALHILAKERDFQVVYRSEVVGDLRTPGAAGELTANEALQQLLSGTGLTFEYLDEKTVTIVPAGEKDDAAAMTKEAVALHTAQADDASAVDASNTAHSAEGSQEMKLEEIVVTAQKRVERLQDVPVPVTVLSAETLVNNNQLRIQDYYKKIPGLAITPQFGGATSIALRGIDAGPGNPTVGVTIDDVPYGGSTILGNGQYVPDLDPSDLAQIEVLRGPQGTLYGASSMGGLLKFVTVTPATDSFSGRLQAGASDVRNGDKLGFNIRGAVNVPLSDTWAVRASGYTRTDPGYIKDSVSGRDGLNQTDATGGRVSALWRPSQDFSIKLGALIQDLDVLDTPEVQVGPGFGELEHGTLAGSLPGFRLDRLAGYRQKSQAYDAVVSAKLAGAELTSITGYSVSTMDVSGDLRGLASLSEALFGVAGTPTIGDHRSTKLTQELRFSTSITEHIEWLAGAFYTDESSKAHEGIFATDESTGELGSNTALDLDGIYLDARFPATYEELAAFTNVTFRITDRFDVQVGGRQSRIEQTYSSRSFGLFTGGTEVAPALVPEVETKADAFTYLLTPRFRISPALMMYARFASGYRAGGPNTNSVALSGISSQYDPDKTQNYEVGIKADVLEHALSFDASIYYIDWKDIQIRASSGGLNYTLNGGRAKSQGVELAVESRPLPGMTINAWVARNIAELTEDFPPDSTTPGRSGQSLPGATPWSGNFSIDQDFPLGSLATGSVGGSWVYVGKREGGFGTLALPSYTQLDLRAGARYESWTLDLFLTNVADKRGSLSGTETPGAVSELVYIRPRTVGISVSKSF
jgi:outer membrane receptor protein involved in Fe transport